MKIYNIDKNGYIIVIVNSFEVFFSKYQKQIFINQSRNHLFVILKCKKKINNKFYIKLIKKYFKLCTKS